MYIELAHCLYTAVDSAFGPAILAAIGADRQGPQFSATQYCALSIEPCPSYIEGDITSNICFKLPKLIADIGLVPSGQHYGPLDAAVAVRQRFLCDDFEVAVSESGHLNFSATQNYRRRLLARILESQVSEIFCGAPFGTVVDVNPFAWDFTNVFQQLRDTADPTTVELLKRREESPTLDLDLLLLSLAADPELDGSKFLRGLSGRQNTPWYLTRYFADSSRWRAAFPAVSERHEVSNEPIVVPTSELLFSFRHELFVSQRSQRPERFFLRVLEVVRDFFRLFNDPRLRNSAALSSRTDLHRIEPYRAVLVRSALEHLFGDRIRRYVGLP